MRKFVYPARFRPEKSEGGFVVIFRDIPEAITQGETLGECIEEAAGALQAAIEGRIISGLNIPLPSRPRRGEHPIAVPLRTALKAALYLAMRDSGISRMELARRLHIDEKEARRMLDPHHTTKSERIEKALTALGRHIELKVA